MFDKLTHRQQNTPQLTECPECGSETNQLYCYVCGYDLVAAAKADRPPPLPM